jgi:GxxExxY protein
MCVGCATIESMTEIENTIREIARDVYADLGSGHDEKVYRRAMEVDLRLRGIKYDSERVLELKYKEHYVGENYADLIVRQGDEVWVLELKAVPGAICIGEKQQLKKYMRTLGIGNGLLINFHKPPISRKRVSGDEPEIEPIVLGVPQKR